jgi:hypothetical protein
LLLAVVLTGAGAEVPKAPVPQSPYLAVVYRYADTMLEHGRDRYGPKKTDLFLSALDRAGLAPLTNRPAPPSGVREGDRAGVKDGALTGANPHHDENLLRLLYTLSELSAKPKYRDAADAELKWFLQNAASPQTHLLPWGEQMSWDVMKDEPLAANGAPAQMHEFFRPWLLWDRCFELAPEASNQFALELRGHQVANHTSGAFERQAGFCIRTLAVAYAYTKEEETLRAIERLLERFEKELYPKSGIIDAQAGHTNEWMASTLSLAIDCDGAAHRVPEPLASRLRAVAGREDEVFCSLPHSLKTHGGFLIGRDAQKDRRTPLWTGRYAGNTTAQVGMMCVSRYDNTGKPAYRELITGAADTYLGSAPGDDTDVWPVTLGHAISLQLAAWRHTARPVYLERARKLADLALQKFWGTNALPRASLKSEHYETITGADTLALALIELHLNILHITAVRCPPNTIDR